MRIRRAVVLASAAILWSLLQAAPLAAGAPLAQPTQQAQPAEQTEQTRQAQQGQQAQQIPRTPLITVAISQEPATLGYGLGATYVGSVVKFALGTEPTLTRQNDQNDWFPYLASDVPLLENGGASLQGEDTDQRLQVLFSLRHDVTWNDGTPVTGHDVKFAWELLMHPEYPVPSRVTPIKISSVEVIDDFTVAISFLSESEARDAAANGRMGLPARVFADFANQEGPVLDPNYYKGFPAFPRHVLEPIIRQVGVARLPQHEINRKPLGVGPFKLKDWVRGQQLITEAVPTYFLGPPRAQSLVFKIVPNTNTVLAQLATGEADVVTEDALSEFNAPDLDELVRQRRIRAVYTPSTTWEHVDLNLDHPLLADVRVRRAIAHAIHRQQIVDRVLFGRTIVIDSWAPPVRPEHNPDVPRYEYDPERARQLLQEAGYAPGPDGVLRKDGQRLSLRYQTNAGNALRELVSQIVQQNLKAVGIEVGLEYLPAAQLFAAGDNPGPLWGRTFELAQYAWTMPDDAATTKSLYHSDSIPSLENGFVGQNFPGFRDARNDELLHTAATTLDQAERLAMYAEQQVIWAEAAPVIPLFARANVTAAKRTLQNLRPTPTSTPLTWNVHEWFLAD